MSTSKFVDAGYTVVYDNKEENYYEKATTKIILSEDAVLRGWQCPRDKLWRVPLIPDVQNFAIGHGIGGKVIPTKMARLAESQSLE